MASGFQPDSDLQKAKVKSKRAKVKKAKVNFNFCKFLLLSLKTF
jgi:hypothetical protein